MQQPIEKWKRTKENKKHTPDMSVDEASAFWDKHEFSEFDDVQKVHDLQCALRKKKYIGIDRHLDDLRDCRKKSAQRQDKI